MKEDRPGEHDWQLAEDQTFPDPNLQPVKIDAKVWQCTKCRQKTYLHKKPPAKYHKNRPAKLSGLNVNWNEEEMEPLEKMDCAEILISHIHDS